jgi:hypothetical protein
MGVGWRWKWRYMHMQNDPKKERNTHEQKPKRGLFAWGGGKERRQAAVGGRKKGETSEGKKDRTSKWEQRAV